MVFTPFTKPEDPENWMTYAREWVKAHGLKEKNRASHPGPSPKHPDANHRMEIVDLKR